MPTVDRYPTLSILMHWVMALLIVAAFGLALYFDELPLSPTKFKLIGWHKWLGITALALVALRLVIRLLTKAPPLPAHMSRLEKLAAAGGHLLLYVLMFAIPLSGWAMSSALGFKVVYLTVLPLPDLVAQNEALGETLKAVHGTLNWILAACVAGHVAFAIKHHVIDRDGTLFRMSFKTPRN